LSNPGFVGTHGNGFFAHPTFLSHHTFCSKFKDGISSLKNTPGCDHAGMVVALTIASLIWECDTFLQTQQEAY
jgi:hypothetical protein